MMLGQGIVTACHVAGELAEAEEEDADAEVEAGALEAALGSEVEGVIGHFYKYQADDLAGFCSEGVEDVLQCGFLFMGAVGTLKHGLVLQSFDLF